MEAAIETLDLGLALAGRPILEGVSLAVAPGEVFGMLGPNGAGKTTTVRLLNGLLRPTRGSARVLGLDPRSHGDAVRRRTGVLTEAPALYERLSARDNLAFFGALHGFGRQETAARVARALDAVGLAPRADDRAGTFSKGMQQRVAIARAILHDPEVLFLDEPTAGLDPESAERVGAIIARWRAAGRTVFLCTHHLGDAERQCDRFAFFARGRVVAHGTREELERQAGARPDLVITFAGEPPELPPVPGVLGVARDGESLVLSLADPAVTPAAVGAAVAAGGRIMRVEPRRASLEALYFALVGREMA